MKVWPCRYFERLLYTPVLCTTPLCAMHIKTAGNKAAMMKPTTSTIPSRCTEAPHARTPPYGLPGTKRNTPGEHRVVQPLTPLLPTCTSHSTSGAR